MRADSTAVERGVSRSGRPAAARSCPCRHLLSSGRRTSQLSRQEIPVCINAVPYFSELQQTYGTTPRLSFVNTCPNPRGFVAIAPDAGSGLPSAMWSHIASSARYAYGSSGT